MCKVAVLLVLSAAALAGGAFIGARPALAHPASPSVAAARPGLRKMGYGSFEQKLDHFSPVDQRTWQQKYIAWNGTDAADGPVFILLGGQKPVLSSNALSASFALQLSDSLRGRSFTLEHRFYNGEKDTRTAPDLTLENLRYLSVDQALADIAYFITYIRKTAMIPEKAKVVLVGGEYAGNLATWARLKYPHLVDAAVASSAPLRAQVAYPEYIVEALKKLDAHFGGRNCGAAIRDVVNYVESESKTAAGLQGLAKTFKLCTPFGAKQWDVDMLLDRLASNLVTASVRQINVEPSYDYIKDVCRELIKAKTSKARAETAAMIGAFGARDEETHCEDVDYEHGIAAARVEAWGATDQDGRQVYDRATLYQSCFELGVFPTLASWKGRYPLELSLQRCKDVFGDAFDVKALEKAVARTNEEYGGDAPDVQKVVFVRGGADPNNVLGVQDDLEDMDPVIELPDRVACSDMRHETILDTQDVLTAHGVIKQRIIKYLDL